MRSEAAVPNNVGHCMETPVQQHTINSAQVGKACRDWFLLQGCGYHHGDVLGAAGYVHDAAVRLAVHGGSRGSRSWQLTCLVLRVTTCKQVNHFKHNAA